MIKISIKKIGKHFYREFKFKGKKRNFRLALETTNEKKFEDYKKNLGYTFHIKKSKKGNMRYLYVLPK